MVIRMTEDEAGQSSEDSSFLSLWKELDGTRIVHQMYYFLYPLAQKGRITNHGMWDYMRVNLVEPIRTRSLNHFEDLRIYE